jgi:hypothetical protein
MSRGIQHQHRPNRFFFIQCTDSCMPPPTRIQVLAAGQARWPHLGAAVTVTTPTAAGEEEAGGRTTLARCSVRPSWPGPPRAPPALLRARPLPRWCSQSEYPTSVGWLHRHPRPFTRLHRDPSSSTAGPRRFLLAPPPTLLFPLLMAFSSCFNSVWCPVDNAATGCSAPLLACSSTSTLDGSGLIPTAPVDVKTLSFWCQS